MLFEYSRYHGSEDLSLAISKVNYLLQISRLQELKQPQINAFFTKYVFRHFLPIYFVCFA